MASAQTSNDLRIPDPAVRAAIGAVLDDYMLPYQRKHIVAPERFRWLCWSRQVGKSEAGTYRRIIRGMARQRDQFFLSAGGFQSKELIGKAKKHVEALQIAFSLSEESLGAFDGERLTQHIIELPRFGIRIIGRPANPMTARGLTGDVFLDEFAMHKADRDIWAAMFPTVTRGDGELDVASTPKGRQNMFYRLADNDAFDHSTVTIDDAIADGLQVDRDMLLAGIGDDELWRQEFLCEFVDEATAFLTYEMIGRCESPGLARHLDLAALRDFGGDAVVGVDIGRKSDLTVIWVFAVDGDHLRHQGLIELVNTPFTEQERMLYDVLACRCVRRCAIDSSGLGMQFAERAQERFGSHRVEAVTFTSLMKQQLAGGLRLKVEDASIQIPVCEKIRNDWHSVTKSVTEGGTIRYLAERTGGSHADRFWAAALAVHAAGADVGRIECQAGQNLQFARQGAW
jgi:phage FluMu gp28-like protein